VLGHYCLWVGGVEHNDISVKNLMYDKDNNDCGILNDYDLAHLNGRPRPSGTDPTGTIPFMAFDLLTRDAWDGKVKRLYRHDCESFAWVLLWICCRYENGKEITDAPLGEFITNDYHQCSIEKHCILARLKQIRPTTSYRNFWKASVALLNVFVRMRNNQDQDLVNDRSAFIEPTNDEMVQLCRKALEGKEVSIFAEPWKVHEEQGFQGVS
jgi:hypothetical protein